MGWFSNVFKSISNKVKSVGNWYNIADKAKKGWNIGTQILGKAREILPKVKRVVEVASLIPGVAEFTAPIAVALETADAFLQTADKYKGNIEKAGKQVKAGYEKVGKYAEKTDQIKSFEDAVGVGKSIFGDVKKIQGRYNRGGAIGVLNPSY
jgi:hypothetical protein